MLQDKQEENNGKKSCDKNKTAEAVILKMIESMISGILYMNGLKLYHIRWTTSYGAKLLQIFLTGEDHLVSAGDCAKVNRFITGSLDETGQRRDFAIEVGTTGIERQLFTPVQFLDATGEEILIKTKSSIGGRKQFKGIISEIRDNNILIKSAKQEWTVPFDMVSKAHIVYDASKFSAS